ncbi:putative laccase-9 isoform X1 [Ziziphus jujuba]|uniref:Laccase n=2 Tax=Ziziphus jujuba TaxID=326968 RepID=A0ABM3IDY4_ZIZJJ|nr:putative laccase-9 isoform X1 [Ziziphus jujuba]
MGMKKMGLIIGFLMGFFFLDGLVLSMAANVHHYSFVLKEANFTRICATKSMLTVNGAFPGPTIAVRKGDTAFVNVHNDGNYGVTIHWHGVKQPRNPWSDGPENITQCPIHPGQNFTYEVNFSDEEGTLWWHAHSDWTRASVHGAIIILPPIGNTYPFPEPDEERTIVLGSWYDEDLKEAIDESTAAGSGPPEVAGYTINGWQGDVYYCSDIENTTYHLHVNYNNTYLLRVVNAVMNEEMFFGIANHTLTVVAQDAAYIKHIVTDYIMITPGQTMDILFTANQTPSYYYMAAKPYISIQFDNLFDEADEEYNSTSAVVHYNGTYTPPSSPSYPNLPNNTNQDAADNFTAKIKSLYNVTVPTNITKSMFITIAVNQIECANQSCGGPNNNRIAASLTNITFDAPTLDILYAYYWSINNGTYTTDFPARPLHYFNFTSGNNTLYEYNPMVGTNVTKVKYGEAVEIVYQGTNLGGAQNHPMHLHGFSFYLIGTGYGIFNETSSPESYNLDDPPLVNTIGVPRNGWSAVRFIADNPGVWFMHCHIEEHATWGMATVIIVENGPTNQTSMKPPPPNMPSCS